MNRNFCQIDLEYGQDLDSSSNFLEQSNIFPFLFLPSHMVSQTEFFMCCGWHPLKVLAEFLLLL